MAQARSGDFGPRRRRRAWTHLTAGEELCRLVADALTGANGGAENHKTRPAPQNLDSGIHNSSSQVVECSLPDQLFRQLRVVLSQSLPDWH